MLEPSDENVILDVRHEDSNLCQLKPDESTDKLKQYRKFTNQS